MVSVRLKPGAFCHAEKDRAQGAPSLYEKASMYVLTNCGCVSHRFLSQQGKRGGYHHSGPALLLVMVVYNVLPAINALRDVSAFIEHCQRSVHDSGQGDSRRARD